MGSFSPFLFGVLNVLWFFLFNCDVYCSLSVAKEMKMYYLRLFFTFLLSLTIGYTPVLVFASAAEDLWVYDAAIREKNRIGVGQVAANNGYLNANVYTKVSKNGSSITVTQPIKIAANDAFYKQSGKIAGSVLRGGVAGLALTVATQAMLDSLDWVMDSKNNSITKKVDPDNYNQACGSCSSYPTYYYVNNYNSLGSFSSVSAAALSHYLTLGPVYSQPSIVSISQRNANTWDVVYKVYNSNDQGFGNRPVVIRSASNPNYLAGSGSTPVSASEVDDAFGDWLKNQPRSITDPVITELYTPFNPVGKGFDGTAGIHFPSVEKTPEIIANMLAHRDAELQAQKKHAEDPENNPAPNNKPEIDNPNKSETSKEPDLNPETEIINHPDGSKTEIRKDKIIDPDTGEIIITTTTTKTDPNGNKTVETSVKREPKPNSETTELPAVCEYFEFLCDWTNWTKEKPDLDKDTEVEIQDKDFDFSVFKTDRFNISKQCPPPVEHSIELTGIRQSFSFALVPLCDVLEMARPALVACSYLYAAYIVIGASRNG